MTPSRPSGANTTMRSAALAPVARAATSASTSGTDARWAPARRHTTARSASPAAPDAAASSTPISRNPRHTAGEKPAGSPASASRTCSADDDFVSSRPTASSSACCSSVSSNTGGRSAERAGRSQLRDAVVVVAEHVAQDVVGVLSDGRRLRGHRQRLADELDRRRQLLARRARRVAATASGPGTADRRRWSSACSR